MAAPGLTSSDDDACPLNLTDAPGVCSSSASARISDEARADCNFPGDGSEVEMIHTPAAATPSQGNKASAACTIDTEKPQFEFEETTGMLSAAEAAGGSEEGQAPRIKIKFSPLPDDYVLDSLDKLLMAILNESTDSTDSGSENNGEEEAPRVGAHLSSTAAQTGGGPKLEDIAFDDLDPFLARIPTPCVLNAEGRGVRDRLYQEHWQHILDDLATQGWEGAAVDRDELEGDADA